jgi:hypothetical protein
MSDDRLQIIVTGDCDCPVCGATEVVDKTLPVREWRWNVRPHKVTDARGLSWSECLRCKETDGNGWFATNEDGDVVIEPSRIAAIEARGEHVERLPA